MARQRQNMRKNSMQRPPKGRKKKSNTQVLGRYKGRQSGEYNLNRIGDSAFHARYGIPTRFPMPGTDVAPVNMKFSLGVNNTAASLAAVSFIYGNGTSAGAVLYMSDFCNGFKQLSLAYSRFLIKRIVFSFTQTTSTTATSYFIANYEATSSTSSTPPTTVADVSNTSHLAEGNATNPSSFVVVPTDYYNDWRATYGDGSTTSTSQMGVSQLYVVNNEAINAAAGLIAVEIECVFAGYRV